MNHVNEDSDPDEDLFSAAEAASILVRVSRAEIKPETKVGEKHAARGVASRSVTEENPGAPQRRASSKSGRGASASSVEGTKQPSVKRARRAVEPFDGDDNFAVRLPQSLRNQADTAPWSGYTDSRREMKSAAAAIVEEHRLSVFSSVPNLEDGLRWRKYGHKLVKGSVHPRSYYKCTTPGCAIQKHVEQSADSPDLFQITYHADFKHASQLRNSLSAMECVKRIDISW